MTGLGQATSRQTAVRLSLQRIAAICSEIWLLFSLFCGVFLVVSLSTFTAIDPGWSNASSNTSGLLGNSGGTIGAWCADVILNLFGYPGYLAPLVLVCGCWYLGRFRFTTLYYADMGLRFTGMLLLLLGSCALAEVYYAHRDILPVGSGGGGVVGSFLADMLLEPVGITGFSLLMLMALASGIALTFNISWLDVATRLGAFLCLVGDRLRRQMLLGSKVCISWLRAKLDSLRQNRAAAMASRHRETLGTGSCQTAEDGVESALNPLPQKNHEVAMPLVAANGSSSALSDFGHDADNEPSMPDVATMKSEYLQGSTVVNPFADQKVSQNFGMAGIDDGEVDTDATSGQDMPVSEPEEPPAPRSDGTGWRRQGIPLPGCADDGIGYELPQQQEVADMQLSEDMTLPPVAAGENLLNDGQVKAAYYYGVEKGGSIKEDEQILPEGVGTEWHVPSNDLPDIVIPMPDDSIVPEGADTELDWNGELKSEDSSSIHALPPIPMPAADDTILPEGVEVIVDSNAALAATLPVISVPLPDDVILSGEIEVAPDSNAALAATLPVISVPLPDDVILSGEVAVAPDSNAALAATLPVISVPLPDDVVLSGEVAVAPDGNAALAATLPVISVPSLSLLSEAQVGESGFDQETMQSMAQMVEQQLGDFGVQCKVVGVMPGPVITCFELELAPGIKGSRVTNLARDLARALSVVSVRVVEIIPGKSVLGLEVPNANRETVNLREILDSKAFAQSDYALPIALGKDIGGKPAVVGLDKMPHLLVAGTTGSGKSVALNAMILSILYRATAQQVRMIMIDPKMLELSVYQDIPHLLAPVVTDMKEASNALQWCVVEMERRYRVLAAAGVRNILGYHSKQKESDEDSPNMPYIVVVIDELADMMMVTGKKVEEQIARLAQKARAAGIHLILATQRPSVDVITGLIKANIPSRVSFQVSSRIDSRTILDQMGAESLLGHGDMLYMPVGAPIPARLHGAFVDDGEVHRVADWLRQASGGVTDYIEDIVREAEEDRGNVNTGKGASGDEDPLYEEARAVVMESRRPTISYVQRRMRIGYNRAARLLEEMEARGVVSAPEGGGNREILQPQAPTAI